MIDPSDLATGVVGGLIQDKLKGALSDAIGNHTPSIHQYLEEILHQLKKLNAYSSPSDNPDIYDIWTPLNGTTQLPYNIIDYRNRSHLLMLSPMAVSLGVSMFGVGSSTTYQITTGWNTLDLPVGAQLNMNLVGTYLMVYSNVARGSWL